MKPKFINRKGEVSVNLKDLSPQDVSVQAVPLSSSHRIGDYTWYKGVARQQQLTSFNIMC